MALGYFRVFLAVWVYSGDMETETVRHDYSVREVARLCACTPETVQAWIAAGKVAAYRLGGDGHYRIPWAELDRVRCEWIVRGAFDGSL